MRRVCFNIAESQRAQSIVTAHICTLRNPACDSMVQMVLASSTCKVPNRAQTAVARPARSTVRVQAIGMLQSLLTASNAADLTVPHVATAGLPREQQADLRTVAAGVAAAALLFTGSAQAGVILEQPEVKKVIIVCRGAL